MKTVIHLLVSALAIIITAYIIPGATVTITGAIIAAIVIALINILIRPVVNIIAMPINVLTLGLFSLVINALLIMLAARVVPGFDVSGFWSAFFFGIVLALVNTGFHMLEDKEGIRRRQTI